MMTICQIFNFFIKMTQEEKLVKLSKIQKRITYFKYELLYSDDKLRISFLKFAIEYLEKKMINVSNL